MLDGESRTVANTATQQFVVLRFLPGSAFDFGVVINDRFHIPVTATVTKVQIQHFAVTGFLDVVNRTFLIVVEISVS